MNNSATPMDACHPQVAARFLAGAPILVVARNSTARGNRGRQQAAQDAVLAIQSLYERGVIDARHLIPDEQTIQRALSVSRDTEVVGEFRGTYWTWTSPDGALRLLVCNGSGTKFDDFGVQPFMVRVRDWVLSQKPSLIWAKELDRLGRDELGLGYIVRAIDTLSAAGNDVWLGSGDRNVFPRYPGWDVNLYFEARQYREQALSLTRRTTMAMVNQTDAHMVDGRSRYALPAKPPAGLDRARLRSARGGKGQSFIFLDSPAFRPDASEYFEPSIPVLDANGDPADQVANVQWALMELADRRPKSEVANILVARGFTTEGFQTTHHRGASYLSVHGRLGADQQRNLCDSILGQVGFYETGVLPRRIAGLQLEIADCLPPGGWAEHDVIVAIRDQLLLHERAEGHRLRSSLGGIEVVVNGFTGVLAMNSYTCRCPAKKAKV